MTPAIGIHDLAVATSRHMLTHAVLADRLGTDPAKYQRGLGQDAMSIPGDDEDVVTMAAAAAAPIVERHGASRIRNVFFATETGVDESKCAGLYLHSLIGLPSQARVVEFKQACYGGTAALQLACAAVARDPSQQALVIAADIARYDLDSAAEPTQGAGAVAMLVSADPAVAVIDPVSGLFSSDIMDFWRPTYRSTAVVDGRYSVSAYLDAIEHAFDDFRRLGGTDLREFERFCYHQPFTKMAFKAHRHLLEHAGLPVTDEAVDAALADTTDYNRAIGNSYTASVYMALASVLDSASDLTGRRIALASYRSGCVAEFLSLTAVDGYREQLRSEANRAAIGNRNPLSYSEYRSLHTDRTTAHDGSRASTGDSGGTYRLSGFEEHKRIYHARQPAFSAKGGH